MGSIMRLARAPFVTVGLVLGAMLVIQVLACISLGNWIQSSLERIGFRFPSGGMLIALGVGTYLALGVAAPALLGYVLIGWVGVALGPLVALVVIAVLDRW